jgi:undecaprenyl-diphosphatase
MLRNLDLAILYFFNHKLANPVLDWLFLSISESKIFLAALIILALGLFWRGSLRLKIVIALMVLCIAIVDPVSHYLLKPLFGRIRPCYTFDNIRLLVGCGGRLSFPSNHAANSFAIAGLVSYFYKRYAAVLYVVAVLIGLSRIYLGRHYPSDVLGGAIFGIIVALLVILMARAVVKYFSSKKIMTNTIDKIQGAMSWKR